MLPDPAAFLRGLAFFLRRRGKVARLDAPAIVEALREAEQLAAGRVEDEPAALFLACARRSRAFGMAAQEVVPFVAIGQARAIGRELAAKEIELAILRLRAVRGALDFEELRAWFAARLRPASPEGP
jgi:hypothetical protein